MWKDLAKQETTNLRLFMKKEQKFQKQRGIRIILVNLFMVSVVLVVTVFLLLISMGFRFGLGGVMERTGMVQINSLPVGANVDVNGERISVRTNLSRTFSPGVHEFRVYADRYDSWTKRVTVRPGILTRLNYVRLFPVDRTTNDVTQYDSVYGVVTAPGRQSIVVMKTMSSWDYIDTRGSSPRIYPVDITAAFSEGELDWATDIEIVDWSLNGRIVLLKVSYQDEGISWSVLDLSKPADRKNLTEAFGMYFTDMKFADGSGGMGISLESGNLRYLDLSREMISAPIADRVDSMHATRGIIGYVRTKANGDKEIGMWREGMAKPRIIESLSSDDIEGLHSQIVFGEFENRGWIAVITGRQCNMYFGDLDRIDRSEQFKTKDSVLLSFDLVHASVSPGGRFVMLELSETIQIIDTENGQVYPTIGRVGGGVLSWMDDYMLFQNTDGDGLVVMDFDGSNERALIEGNKLPILVSPDNRWMYYFEEWAGGVMALKRWQILY